ncbi:hypothetical protein Tco_0318578 [Tanacetum coccineum]
MEGGGEQGDENGDDYEGGNGGGNGNGGVNGNGNVHISKMLEGSWGASHLNFNGWKECWVDLIGSKRWRRCSTLRAIGIEVAYAMTWTELSKVMTEVYCLRNEIHKTRPGVM